MDFEAHITVSGKTDKTAGVWKEFCKARGYTPLHIKLSSGLYIEQFMASIQLPDTLSILAGLDVGLIAGELNKNGWGVQRIKIETPLNPNHISPCLYFEAHWNLGNEVNPTILKDLKSDIASLAHSKNEYTGNIYLTSRLSNTAHDAKDAYAKFIELTNFIKQSYTQVDASHFEKVLVDTNRDLDKDWF